MDKPNWDDLSPTKAQEEAPSWESLSKAEPTTTAQAPDTPNWDDLESKDDKFGSTGQQVLTGVEGAAQGFLGPVATAAEAGLSKLGVEGLSPEEQKARAETNPWVSGLSKAGGMGAGLLTGTGELGLLSAAGEAGAAAAGLGEATTAAKVGSAAIKGLLETAGYQAGEEASKYINDDPEQSVSSALSNTGMAGLIGGGLGGGLSLAATGAAKGLKAFANTKLGTNAGQLLADFGNRWSFHEANPDLAQAVTGELKDFYGNIVSATDNDFGSVQLKDQALQKLVPEINDSIKSQQQKISDQLQSSISEMAKDPESYPSRLTKKLISDANNWSEMATNPNASSFELFKNTEALKQKLQYYAKFEKQINPLAPEGPFVASVKSLSHDLRKSLEDTKVWGDAGDLQRATNQAYSQLIKKEGPLATFEKRFVTNNGNEWTINPSSVNTYVNQLNKPTAEIKKDVLENFVKASEKYRDQINDLHARFGLESPFTATSLNATKGTYGQTTPGAEWADKAFHGWAPDFAFKAGQSIVGAEYGREHGGLKGAVAGGIAGLAAPYVERALLKKVTTHAIPMALKVLSAGRPTAIAEALEHAQNIHRGSSLIENGVNSLFTGSKIAIPEAASHHVEKIKKFVEGGGVNQQLQNQMQMDQKSAPVVAVPTQGFAHGGEVKAPLPPPAQPPDHSFGKLGEALPEHNILLNTAKARVYNYLNTIRPQANKPKLAFDRDMPDKSKEKSYHRALHLAAQPLGILHSIQNGSLSSQELQHFKQLWPEIHNQLSKKMTEEIMHSQLDDSKKPPYKVKQAMSLFMGSNLDSTLKPEAIQAAQAVYQKRPQGPQGPAKSTAKLGELSKQAQTPSQAIMARQQRDR